MAMARVSVRRGTTAAVGLAVVTAAIGIRILFVGQLSGDYTAFVSPWYDFIATHGRFEALRFDFANYNPPYLYLLTIATLVPVPKLVAIKAISVIFDLVLALFTYLIVDLRRQGPLRPAVCASAMLFAPSIVINSSAWGQCDSIYAAFCLGSLYFLLVHKPWWAAIFFGVALSFKLQAIFFLPVLVIVFAADRRLRMKSLIAVPLVFMVMLAPALLAGRSVTGLLDIYPQQITSGGQVSGGVSDSGAPSPGTQPSAAQPPAQPPGGTGGPSPAAGGPGGASETDGRPGSFTYNAANFYQWIGQNASTLWKYLGFLLTVLVVGGLSIIALSRRLSLDQTQAVLLAAAVVAVVPFLLPEMHERYFYLADVFCIVAAGFRPKLGVVALAASLCSLAAYAPFLWNVTPVNLAIVAIVELLVLLAMAGAFLQSMRERELLQPNNSPAK